METYVPTPTRGVSEEERNTYKKLREENCLDGKLIVHRFPLFAEGKNAIIRAIRYVLAGIIQLYYGLKAKNVDCIFLASTPPIQGVIGALLKRWKKRPFIYNLQDIFPDSLVGTGLTKKGSLFWRIGRSIENFTYRNADKIIVISEEFKQNILEKGVPEEKIEVVYNWIDPQEVFPTNRSSNPLYQTLQIDPSRFSVVYAGNMGNAQNIEVILEAAEKLVREKDVQFLLFGTGGMKDKYEKLAQSKNLSNVYFFPLQPIEMVSYVYGLGDLCVVSCKPGMGGSAMPSKLLSILSAGQAVLSSFDQGELTNTLERYNCGICTKVGDSDSLADAILRAKINPEKCIEMGENGRNLILKFFTREQCTQKYIEIIKQFEINH